MNIFASSTSAITLDLLFVLATAAAVSLIFQRFRIAAIAGYLVAGAIVGPHALGLIHAPESVESIGQIAIVLLMFGIGMNLDRRDLRAGMLPVLGIGVGSTVLIIVLGAPVVMLFGLTLAASVGVAAAIAISSTALVLRKIQQRREMRQAHGRITFGTLITQDLAAVLVLAMIPVLAGASAAGGAAFDPLRTGGRVALTVGLVAVMIVVGTALLPRLLAEAARDTSSELLLVLSAAVGLGAAMLTAALGLSPELGAFLAGFLLAGTPFRYQLAGQIGPMRDLFMAVFFTAVGMSVDMAAAAELWWVVLLALGATLVVKFVSISVTAWAFGAPPAVAVTVGITLAQAGEFTLVVSGVAAGSGLFGEHTASTESTVVTVVFLSLIVTPALMSVARRAGSALVGWPQAPWLSRGALARRAQPIPQSDQPSRPVRRALVAGFGPVGRAVADRLAASGFEVSIIELNRKTVDTQAALGRRIVYGDATNPDVLESAGVREADAVVLTVPDDQAMLRACKAVRGVNANAYIAARTNYLSTAFLAREQGASHVTVEELATAEAMVREILARIGASAPPAPVTPASS
jgi:CPA2 family monovalent cation:H+ antiporter-2